MRQLHREERSISISTDEQLPIFNKEINNTGNSMMGEYALPISHLLGISSVVLVSIWCGAFRGGLKWSDPNKELLFNFHPLLMIAGFIFLHGEANLVYKTASGTKNYRKLLHLVFQGLALLMGLMGVYAAFKFHNEKQIDNFYSLHSWLGILTITLFLGQWIMGFVTYWYPGGAGSTRVSFLPWHVFLGLFIYILTLVTAETGILEKVTFLQTNKIITRYGNEAFLANSLGIILVLLGFFVFIALCTPKPRAK